MLPHRTRADRTLESTLLFVLLVHILALFTMAFFLLPAMPGAGLATPQLRLAYVHAHPILWHLGWLPWHLCALSDLMLSMALFRQPWVPYRASVPTLLLTVIAVVIEQIFECSWEFLATSSNAKTIVYFPSGEHVAFIAVCCIAATIYAVMAMGWSWALSFAPDWTRTLTVLSCITWPALLFASTAPLFPAPPPHLVINAANQLGFVLMTFWFALALEAVLRRTRVAEPVGRMTPWRAADAGLLGRAQELLANSRLAQYLAEFFPKPVLASHIRDVVYLNFLTKPAHVAPLLPGGLELQPLGPNGEYTLFSVLLYRHGRFGPRALGGGFSCRGFPSPIQSNWRLYVRDTRTGETGIFFTTTTLSKLPAAILARVLSRGVPMHSPASSTLIAHYGDAPSAELSLTPGHSSAPSLSASLHGSSPTLPPGPWSECFPTYESFLQYTVPQDRAISVQSWDERTTAQEIDLPAPPDTCIPLAGEVHSAYIQSLCGNAQSLSFLLPEVHFTMRGERVLHPGRLFSES